MLPAGDAAERSDGAKPARRGLVLVATGYAVVALAVLYVATYNLEGTGRFVLTVLAIGPAPFFGLALGRRLSKAR